MIKVGFIGFGKSANRYHMPFIDLLQDKFEMVGYFTKGDNNFKMEYKINNDLKSFNTIKDLFKNVDLVIINTPSKFHYEYTKESLLAGKNVICEKPITNSLEELNELYEIAKEKKLLLTPYQNRRFDTDFLTTIKAINTNEIGDVIEIETLHSQYRIDPMYSEGTIYDGAVMGHAVHFVDQIVSVFGEPENIVYDLCNSGWKAITGKDSKADDYYDIKLIYKNLRVRLKYSRLTAKQQPRWIVNGTKGTIETFEIDQQESYLKKGIFPIRSKEFGISTKNRTILYTVLDSNEDQPIIEKRFFETVNGGYQNFYINIFKAINKEEELLVTEKQAKVVINILTTIVEGRNYKKIIDQF